MKKNILFLITLTTAVLYSQESFSNGNTVRNGGDTTSAEFIYIAKDAVNQLKKNTYLTEDLKNLTLQIEKIIPTTKVSSTDQALYLDATEVTAINTPSEQSILINRGLWSQTIKQKYSMQVMIVLHEFLWIAGQNDDHYRLSEALTSSTFFTKSMFDDFPPVAPLIQTQNSQNMNLIDVLVLFSSTTIGPEISGYECSLNEGNNYFECASPYTLSFEKDKTQTLFIRAVNIRGAYSAPNRIRCNQSVCLDFKR